jgi:hypothetical protein
MQPVGVEKKRKAVQEARIAEHIADQLAGEEHARAVETALEPPLPHLSRRREQHDAGCNRVGLSVDQEASGSGGHQQDVVKVERVRHAVGADETGHFPQIGGIEQQLPAVLGAVECHAAHRRKVPTPLRCVHSAAPPPAVACGPCVFCPYFRPSPRY